MTAPDLAAIQARAAAATPGPWRSDPEEVNDLGGCDTFHHVVTDDVCVALDVDSEADAEFIAHAREDVPALLARIRELEADVAHWKRRAEANQEIDRRAGMLAGVETERDAARADLARIRAVLDDPATVEAVAEAMVRDLTCEDSCAVEHAIVAVRVVAERITAEERVADV